MFTNQLSAQPHILCRETSSEGEVPRASNSSVHVLMKDECSISLAICSVTPLNTSFIISVTTVLFVSSSMLSSALTIESVSHRDLYTNVLSYCSHFKYSSVFLSAPFPHSWYNVMYFDTAEYTNVGILSGNKHFQNAALAGTNWLNSRDGTTFWMYASTSSFTILFKRCILSSALSNFTLGGALLFFFFLLGVVLFLFTASSAASLSSYPPFRFLPVALIASLILSRVILWLLPSGSAKECCISA